MPQIKVLSMAFLYYKIKLALSEENHKLSYTVKYSTAVWAFRETNHFTEIVPNVPLCSQNVRKMLIELKIYGTLQKMPVYYFTSVFMFVLL